MEKQKQPNNSQSTFGTYLTPLSAYIIILLSVFIAGGLLFRTKQSFNQSSAYNPFSNGRLQAQLTPGRLPPRETPPPVFPPVNGCPENQQSPPINIKSPIADQEISGTTKLVASLADGYSAKNALFLVMTGTRCNIQRPVGPVTLKDGVFSVDFNTDEGLTEDGTYNVIAIALSDDLTPLYSNQTVFSIKNHKNPFESVNINSIEILPKKATYKKGESIEVSWVITGPIPEAWEKYRTNPVIDIRMMAGTNNLGVFAPNIRTSTPTGGKAKVTIPTNIGVGEGFKIRVEPRGKNGISDFVFGESASFSVTK